MPNDQKKGLRELIDYDELETAVIDLVSDLSDGIEAFTVEKGYDFPDRDFVFDCLTDAIREIHVETFLKKKQRKVEKWFKRLFKKIV